MSPANIQIVFLLISVFVCKCDINAATPTFHPSLSLLQALYERCDRLRPSLFRLASDTVDDDAALAQILTANDELTLAVNVYKERVGKGVCNGRSRRSQSEEEVTDKSNGLVTKCLILHTLSVEKIPSPCVWYCSVLLVFDPVSSRSSSYKSQRD